MRASKIRETRACERGAMQMQMQAWLSGDKELSLAGPAERRVTSTPGMAVPPLSFLSCSCSCVSQSSWDRLRSHLHRVNVRTVSEKKNHLHVLWPHEPCRAMASAALSTRARDANEIEFFYSMRVWSKVKASSIRRRGRADTWRFF